MFFSRKPKLKPVVIEDDKGFFNVALPVVTNTHTGGWYRFELRGEHKGRPVAASLLIRDSLQSNEAFLKNTGPAEDLYIGREAVHLNLLGSEGENFCRLFAEAYGNSETHFQMPRCYAYEIAPLQGDPQPMLRDVRMKLFYASDDEVGDRYYELYIVTTPSLDSIWFREKDHEYRDPILRSFGLDIPFTPEPDDQ